MFNELKIAYIRENNEQLRKTIEAIKEGNTATLRYYLTKLRIEQLEKEVITIEEAQSIAIKRAVKKSKENENKKLKFIEEVGQAEEIETITINVEWTKNRTWGMNPTAYVYTQYTGRTTGTASGCGYDKESTAIAEAFNKNKNILKIIYNIKNEALKNDANISSRDAIGYGSGYYAVPYFEGGVGTNCFLSIFKGAGYEINEVHGKISDSYIIRKGVTKK